jgi:hypothetical protein
METLVKLTNLYTTFTGIFFWFRFQPIVDLDLVLDEVIGILGIDHLKAGIDRLNL